MDDAIVKATWGLVAVTALLVVATLVPLITDMVRRRDEKSAVAIRTIPDLNILRSRLDGACSRLVRPAEVSEKGVAALLKRVEGELEMLFPIIEVRKASLEFTNELFILRHLLTYAHASLHEAEELFDEPTAEQVRQRDEAMRKAQRAYRAALLTLDAAEELLPKKHRTISGERFWDRFARVSDDRENQAAQAILQDQAVHRTQSRS